MCIKKNWTLQFEQQIEFCHELSEQLYVCDIVWDRVKK